MASSSSLGAFRAVFPLFITMIITVIIMISASSFSPAAAAAAAAASPSIINVIKKKSKIEFPQRLLDAIGKDSSFVIQSNSGRLLHEIDEKFSTKLAKPQNFCFISHGCWGGSDFGKITHKQVARLIAEKTKELDAQFILTAGDNFYTKGLKSVEDRRFNETFRNPYVVDQSPTMNNIPFVLALGNHDARGNIFAQINMTYRDPNWFFPYTYYSVLFRSVSLGIVVLDCPLFERCAVNPAGSARCWDKDYQRDFLEQSLKFLQKEKIAHRIVMCHYPLYANGPHVNHKFLRNIIDPMMEKYHVSMYVNADNHYMQVSKHKKNGIYYVNSGGGGGYKLHSKKDKGFRIDENNVFHYMGNGAFTHCLDLGTNKLKSTAFGIKNGQKSTKDISYTEMFTFETDALDVDKIVVSEDDANEDGDIYTDEKKKTEAENQYSSKKKSHHKNINNNNNKLKVPPVDGGGEDFERLKEIDTNGADVEDSASVSSSASANSIILIHQPDKDSTAMSIVVLIVIVMIVFLAKATKGREKKAS